MEMFRKWDAFLGPRLTQLVEEVTSYTAKAVVSSAPADGVSRFVYFNRMNLATKSTVHKERRAGQTVTPQVLRLLADMNVQHLRYVLDDTPPPQSIGLLDNN